MFKTASCPLIVSTLGIISFTPEEEQCLRHRGVYFYLRARLPLRTSDPCVHLPPWHQHLPCLRSTSNLTSSKLNSFLKYSVSKWHHGLCCHSACVLPPQYHWDLLSPSQLPPPFARLPSSYSPPGRAGQPHPITCPLDVCTPNTLTYYFSS